MFAVRRLYVPTLLWCVLLDTTMMFVRILNSTIKQFSHYVVFFVAIFTVLQLVMLGASTYPIRRRWDAAAYITKDEVLCLLTHCRSMLLPLCEIYL